MSDSKNAKDFIDLLAAAMLDAATTGHITQLQSVIRTRSGATKMVRIVVLSEEMDLVRESPDAPFKRPE